MSARDAVDEAERLAAEASLPFTMEGRATCKLCGFTASESMLSALRSGGSAVALALSHHMQRKHPEVPLREVAAALLRLMGTPPKR